MAMLSYSPIIHYLIVKNLVLPNDPDAVVMMIDASDIQDDAIYRLMATLDSDGRPVAVTPMPDYDLLPLKMEMGAKVLARIWANGGQFSTHVQKRENRLGHYYQPSGLWTEAIGQTLEYVEMTASLLREKNIPFILIFHPYPVVLNDRAPFAQWMTKWGFDPTKRYRAEHFDKALIAWSHASGVPYLNLEADVLRIENRLAKDGRGNEEFYRVNDAHFTEIGNQWIAEPMVEYLLTHLTDQTGAVPSKKN
jgi:hypothetical protein